MTNPGLLLPLRLAHVAANCPPLARQSLSMAIDSAKHGKNVTLYSNLLELATRLGFSDLAQPDQTYLTKQEEGNKRELSRLEGELRGYKNNLIRESMRMGQEDLAMHHLVTGGPLPNPNNPQTLSTAGYLSAYHGFTKMRDYCVTPTHVASMTLHLVYTALVQAVSAQQSATSPVLHFNSAMSASNRLRTVGVKEEEQVKLTPISCVTASIAQIGLGNFREAAAALLITPFDYTTQGVVHNRDWSKAVASGNDVAIYGGLCALATMTRDDLVNIVLGGQFRAFLELEPHMRKAISLYTTAKYQACLDTLRHYYADWKLDVFLARHVDRLFGRIREKSITAYFASFSEVSLASLASTFPPLSSAPDAMENELLAMIESGVLDARLDVVDGKLVAPRRETRGATQAEAKAAAEEVERTLLLRLSKVNMTLAGLEVPKLKGGGWGGQGLGVEERF